MGKGIVWYAGFGRERRMRCEGPPGVVSLALFRRFFGWEGREEREEEGAGWRRI